MDYREHNEIAKAYVKADLTVVNNYLDRLIGWMDTAGYTAGEMDRAIAARGELRALYNVIVVVNEESENGTMT
jgi:hypothetical protein